MLTINKSIENGKGVLTPVGRLDTLTAPEMEKVVKETVELVSELVIDLCSLEYVSSAGLRVLLAAQKAMNSKGKMIVKNVNETVAEIFEVTGFIDILDIE